jgi:hypothetical protein
MKCLGHIVIVVVLALLPCGCASSPPADFPNLAGAFKFVGVCSVIASCVWAYAIITSSNNKKGG